MDILIIIAIILAVAGIVGGLIPVVPGPPLSWVALLLVYFSDKADGQISTSALLIWLLVVIIVTVLDYILPAVLSKATGGHKGATRGATLGLIAGMLFTPVGMILGSFLGAFLGEFFSEGQDFFSSLKAAAGTFIAFILTTGLKVICSSILLWQILKIVF